MTTLARIDEVRRLDLGFFVRPAGETGTGLPRIEPVNGYPSGKSPSVDASALGGVRSTQCAPASVVANSAEKPRALLEFASRFGPASTKPTVALEKQAAATGIGVATAVQRRPPSIVAKSLPDSIAYPERADNNETHENESEGSLTSELVRAPSVVTYRPRHVRIHPVFSSRKSTSRIVAP